MKGAPFTELLSVGEILLLDALDGTETLANAKEVFPSGIDENFRNFAIDKASIATKEQVVDVYKLEKELSLPNGFGSLQIDLGKLCLTQAQIKNFCKNYSNWLNKGGHATLFMFKVEGQFLVANVFVRSSGLYVDMFWFEDDYVWFPGLFRYMVVPRLTI